MIDLFSRLKIRFESLFCHDQWTIGVAPLNIPALLKGEITDVRWILSPPREWFYADPFLFSHQNINYIFFELYDYLSHKGRIAYTELGTDREGEIIEILNLPFHLSYPSIIIQEQNIFLVPESSANNEVSLYKAIEFPCKWEKISVLLENTAVVDATIFFHQDIWWMFYTDLNQGAEDKLFIAFANKLDGPWTKHPLNPVKESLRSSRSAGRPFFYQGHWYRPAQDCQRTYGGAISLMKITQLSTSNFSEEFVCLITANKFYPYSFGTHHLCIQENMLVIDAKRRHFSRHSFLRVIKRNLKKLPIARFLNLSKENCP